MPYRFGLLFLSHSERRHDDPLLLGLLQALLGRPFGPPVLHSIPRGLAEGALGGAGSDRGLHLEEALCRKRESSPSEG